MWPLTLSSLQLPAGHGIRMLTNVDSRRVQKGKHAGPSRHCEENGASEPRRREADGFVCALGPDMGGHRSGAGCV